MTNDTNRQIKVAQSHRAVTAVRSFKTMGGGYVQLDRVYVLLVPKNMQGLPARCTSGEQWCRVEVNRRATRRHRNWCAQAAQVAARYNAGELDWSGVIKAFQPMEWTEEA